MNVSDPMAVLNDNKRSLDDIIQDGDTFIKSQDDATASPRKAVKTEQVDDVKMETAPTTGVKRSRDEVDSSSTTTTADTAPTSEASGSEVSGSEAQNNETETGAETEQPAEKRAKIESAENASTATKTEEGADVLQQAQKAVQKAEEEEAACTAVLPCELVGIDWKQKTRPSKLIKAKGRDGRYIYLNFEGGTLEVYHHKRRIVIPYKNDPEKGESCVFGIEDEDELLDVIKESNTFIVDFLLENHAQDILGDKYTPDNPSKNRDRIEDRVSGLIAKTHGPVKKDADGNKDPSLGRNNPGLQVKFNKDENGVYRTKVVDKEGNFHHPSKLTRDTVASWVAQYPRLWVGSTIVGQCFIKKIKVDSFGAVRKAPSAMMGDDEVARRIEAARQKRNRDRQALLDQMQE